jgi:hypothetical protein
MMRAAYAAAGQSGTSPTKLTARMMTWLCTAQLRRAKRALEAGQWSAAARALVQATTLPPLLLSEAERVKIIMDG